MLEKISQSFDIIYNRKKFFLRMTLFYCSIIAFAILPLTKTFAWFKWFNIIFILGSFAYLIHISNKHLLKPIKKRFKKDAMLMERDLQEIQKALLAIQDGDFANLINSDKFKKLERLAKVLNIFIHNMRFIVEQIQSSSIDMGYAVQEILDYSYQEASRSVQQASSVAEITATMEELAKTAAQISDNSDNVFHLAQNSNNLADDGFNSLTMVTHGIENIENKMKIIDERTTTLGNKSKQISKVLEIITNIANDTHLLALNASIEAASAGEFGERFSVVAAEIRRLALKSFDSIQDIKNIIDEIHKSINDTILSSEEGTKEVKKSVEVTKEIEKNLLQIRDKIRQTTSASKEISIATQQQRTASDQIVMTLKDISSVSKQTASGLEDAKKSAENLSEISTSLQLLAQNFVLESEQSMKYLITQLASDDRIVSLEHNPVKMKLMEMLNKYPFFELAFCVDKNGDLIELIKSREKDYNLENSKKKYNFADREWYKQTVTLNKIFLTEPYLSLQTNQKCVTISAPIKKNEEIIGVVGLDLNLSDWKSMSKK